MLQVCSNWYVVYSGKTLVGFDLCMSMLEDDAMLQYQMKHIRENYHQYAMKLKPEYFNVSTVTIDTGSLCW